MRRYLGRKPLLRDTVGHVVLPLLKVVAPSQNRNDTQRKYIIQQLRSSGLHCYQIPVVENEG